MVPLWSAVWRSDSEIQEFQVSQKTIISFFGLRQWPNCPTKHLRSLWVRPGPIESVYLGYPVEGLLELQVLPCLAGQVHPFALDPLHSGFTQKVFGLHLGDEVNVSALDIQRRKCSWQTHTHNFCTASPFTVYPMANGSLLLVSQSGHEGVQTRVQKDLAWIKMNSEILTAKP